MTHGCLQRFQRDWAYHFLCKTNGNKCSELVHPAQVHSVFGLSVYSAQTRFFHTYSLRLYLWGRILATMGTCDGFAIVLKIVCHLWFSCWPFISFSISCEYNDNDHCHYLTQIKFCTLYDICWQIVLQCVMLHSVLAPRIEVLTITSGCTWIESILFVEPSVQEGVRCVTKGENQTWYYWAVFLPTIYFPLSDSIGPLDIKMEWLSKRLPPFWNCLKDPHTDGTQVFWAWHYLVSIKHDKVNRQLKDYWARAHLDILYTD